MLDGQVQVGDEPFPHEKHNTLVLSSDDNEDGVTFTLPQAAPGSTPSAHFVLVAGEPLKQRVIQYGPFVVNTPKQVQQAFEDYQLGRNGFEKAPGWSSDIGKELRRH